MIPSEAERMRAEHEAFEQVRGQRWFAQLDDLVGGAIVATVDKPASSIDYEAGDRVLAWGIWAHTADHLVRLHNNYLTAMAAVEHAADPINPDDYDESSPEGKHDLAFDDGYREGMLDGMAALGARFAEIVEAACREANQAKDQADLFDILARLHDVTHPEAEEAAP